MPSKGEIPNLLKSSSKSLAVRGVFRYSITFQLARGDKLGVHFRIGPKYEYLVVNGVDFDGLAAVTDGVYGMCMEEESELI